MKTVSSLLCWLAYATYSMSWIALLHVYTRPDLRLGVVLWLFSLLAIICSLLLRRLIAGASWMERNRRVFSFRNGLCVFSLIAASCTAAFLLSRNLLLSLFLLYLVVLRAASWAARGMAKEYSGRRNIEQYTAVILLQVPFIMLAIKLISAHGSHPVVAKMQALAMSLAGIDAVASATDISIRDLGINYHALPSAEYLGIYPFLPVFIGCLILLHRKSWRYICAYVLIFLAYLSLRWTIITSLIAHTNQQSVAFGHTSLILSAGLLILPAAIMEISGRRSQKQLWRRPNVRHRAASIFAAISLPIAFFLVAMVTTIRDPGTPKEGRILIDDSHGGWEPTNVAFDTLNYSPISQYNYYCFKEVLADYYPVVAVNSRTPLDAIELKDFDVIILKTPTKAYTKEEIDSLISFVKAGGGLLLISDHTNLMGMSTHLNAVANRFGAWFKSDDTFDLVTRGLCALPISSLGAHPAVCELDTIFLQTSCTIVGTGLDNALIGACMGAESADYSHPNFFGDIEWDQDEHFGLFAQLAFKPFGKGRVGFFTDSTIWSNFSIFYRDRWRLALGIMEFLNRRNKYDHAIKISSMATLLLLLIGVFALWVGSADIDRILHSIGTIAVECVTLWNLGLLTGTAINAAAYSPRKPMGRLQHVGFLMTGVNATIEDAFADSYSANPALSFTKFFTWTARMGMMPQILTEPDKLDSTFSMVVVIYPDHKMNSGTWEALINYSRAGGKLLILDSVTISGSILRPRQGSGSLGVGYAPEYHLVPRDSTLMLSHQGLSPVTIKLMADGFEGVEIVPGIALYLRAIGTGKLGILIDGYYFSQASYGECYSPYSLLDKELRKLYSAQYEAFRIMMDEDIPRHVGSLSQIHG